MAMFDDLNILRDAFVMNKNPFFVVKGKGGDVLFTNYDIEDVEIAGDEIVKRLSMYGDVGEIKIYQLPKVPKNSISKLQVDGGLLLTYQKPRKVSAVEDRSYHRPTSGSGDNIFAFELIKSMREENKELREQYNIVNQKLDNLITMQQTIDDSDDDDDIADQSQNNFLGALMGNPVVQNFLLNIMSNAMGGNKSQKPTAMAGTDPIPSDPEAIQMELTQLINNLLAKGVTIEHLRKLSAMPDDKIKFLLGML